jgi:hypothetical protein
MASVPAAKRARSASPMRESAKRDYELDLAAARREFEASIAGARAKYVALVASLQTPTTLRAVIQFWLADGGKHLITKCKNSLSDLNSTHSWWANARGGAGVSSNERYEALVDAEMRVHSHPLDDRIKLPATWAAVLYDAAAKVGRIDHAFNRKGEPTEVLLQFEYTDSRALVTENIGHEFTLAPGVAPDFKAFATAVDATVQLPF